MRNLFFGLMAIIAIQAGAQSNWTVINTGVSFILTDISFPGNQDSIGYAVGMSSTYNGNGVILKTTDAGNTWNQISTGIMPGLEALAFTSVDTGYIGGWQNYFAKTTNGGLTWTTSTVNSSIWYITGIEFYDSQNGIVTAAGAEAYVTANGGQSWTPATGLAVNAQDIDYASASVVYIVGGDEKIARSTNGGLSWTTIYTGIFQLVFLGVDFYDLNHGIVGGEDGKVLRASNGGQTWQTSYAGAGYHLLRAAYMFDTSNAIIAGTPEGIFITDNGGATWASDYSGGNTFAIYKADFNASGAGFLCGSQGRIFKKNAPISADFSVNASVSCSPDSFMFTNNSTGPIDIWLWSFPGGNPSQHNGQIPPPIYYGAPGVYNVELIIISGSQSDTLVQTGVVEILAPQNPVIAGNNYVLVNSQQVYSTPNVAGTTYNWSVLGGSIQSGQGTHELTVLWTGVGTATIDLSIETAEGCEENASSYSVDVYTDIGLEEASMDFEIFPNPFGDQLKISMAGHAESTTVEVMDALGRIVISAVASNNIVLLDSSSWPAGVYHVRLSDSISVKSSTVVKR